MSRLVLTASGSGHVTAPPSSTGPGPLLAYPQTNDTRLLALRPNRRSLGSLSVDTDYPVTATNFHTLGAAIDAAKTIAYTQPASGSVTWSGFPHPDYRVDIFVAPGTYNESFGTPDFINIVGVTGDRADVVFENGEDSGGVMHAFGNIYVEGVTLHGLAPTNPQPGEQSPGPKYALHVTLTDATTVIANCSLHIDNPGHAYMGMDGGSDSTLLLYDCDVRDGVTPPGSSTNMHGAPGNTGPVTIIYDNCPTMAHPQFSAGSDTGPDHLWAINGTPTSFVTEGNVTTHTSGDPGVAHGLSSRQQTKFLPSYVTGPFPQDRRYAPSDAAPMHPVTGRTYFVPVPLAGRGSLHITGSTITVTSAAGKWIGRPIPAQGSKSAPDVIFNLDPNAGQALASGENYQHFYYFSTLGSLDTCYVGLAFSNASAQVVGSTQITSDYACWYTDDGTTLVRATGVPFPVAGVESAS